MKLEYGFNFDVENSDIIKEKIENANNFMGSFELSGVFSDKFIEAVHKNTNKLLEARIDLDTKKITAKEGANVYNKCYNDFKKLLDTYCIFSKDYKSNLLGIFHSIYY